MPPLGEPLHATVLDADAPQLAGAAVVRRDERDPAAVAGDPDHGPLGRRQVAGHPGGEHQVVRSGQVAAAVGPGIGAVRREQPQVRARPPAHTEAMADRRDRAAVGQPLRGAEHGAPAAGDHPLAPGRHVHHEDVRALAQVGVPRPVGRERDLRAVRRPRRRGRVGPATRQGPDATRLDVDHRELDDPVVQEACAIEHVAQAIDVAIVRGRRLAVAPVGRRGPVGRHQHQAARIRGPREVVDAARQVRQPPRLATAQRQQVDLGPRSLGRSVAPAVARSGRRLVRFAVLDAGIGRCRRRRPGGPRGTRASDRRVRTAHGRRGRRSRRGSGRVRCHRPGQPRPRGGSARGRARRAAG